MKVKGKGKGRKAKPSSSSAPPRPRRKRPRDDPSEGQEPETDDMTVKMEVEDEAAIPEVDAINFVAAAAADPPCPVDSPPLAEEPGGIFDDESEPIVSVEESIGSIEISAEPPLPPPAAEPGPDAAVPAPQTPPAAEPVEPTPDVEPAAPPAREVRPRVHSTPVLLRSVEPHDWLKLRLDKNAHRFQVEMDKKKTEQHESWDAVHKQMYYSRSFF